MNHAYNLPSSHRDRTARERRRLKAAKLFAEGHTQAEIARIFKVSREAVRKWHDGWKRAGAAGLRSAGNPGPKPRLTPAKLARVEQALLKGPAAYGYATQLWTVGRIAAVIHKVAKVSHHPSYVWKLLTAMNWSCQKPETRAAERDEAAIRHWQKATWPRLKKKRSEWAQSLLSGTSPVFLNERP